ncbi:MAG: tetratricopeptide repeat protein [Desulfomonile tiedjei]|nr:tetratricopeptide repeat protein [Desulfomonile tiedjei]
MIVIVTAAVYSPVPHQGFSTWDDPKHIAAVWKPGWERAWTVLTDVSLRYSDVRYYIPLHFLSLMADQAVVGVGNQPQAWIAKIMNVALHCANASLVFGLLVMFGLGTGPALLGAFVFALHPVQVGTVAWVAERKNLLSALFYLSALLAFTKHLHTGRFRYIPVVAALFVLGLLSKPSVVTLPVALAGLLMIPAGTEAGKSRPAMLIGLLALVAVGWSAYVISTEVSYPGILPAWFLRPLMAAGVVWFYLAAFLYPVNLVLVYPRWDVAGNYLIFFLLLFALLALLAAVIRYRGQIGPYALWGLFFFLINIAPVSGIVPFGYMGHSFVADHLLYLPMVGLVTVVAAGSHLLFARLADRRALVALLWSGAAMATGILGILSAKQISLWKDPASLWAATLQVNQGSAAVYHNYGAVCMERGEFRQALALFQRAAELAPLLDVSYNNMGKIYLSLGQRDKAREMFERSLQANPRGAVPRVVLGQMLQEEGKHNQAVDFYRRSLDELPTNAALRTALARAYFATGQASEALHELDTAIRLSPLASEPYAYKAHILLSRGETGAAITLLRHAIGLRGNDAAAHDMLGTAYASRGEWDLALAEFTKAHQLTPDLPGVRDHIANSLMEMGDFPEATAFCSRSQEAGTPCSEETVRRVRRGTSDTKSQSKE